MGLLKSLFLLVFLSCGVAGFSQSALDELAQQYQTYQQHTLQEKIYIHTDKTTYLAGEILWFKIYNVDAGQRTPLDVSKVAYVDVLDRDNQFLAQVKVPLKEGRGDGSVLLPLRTTTGNYKLRAYTAWMKNFGPEQFFEKSISVINTLRNLDVPAADTVSGYTAQFFPEGGNLVNGLESVVALQVTAVDGIGQSFYATVVTENGDSVAVVRSLQFGSGRFSFTPAAAHTYTAIIHLLSGRIVKAALPHAADQGYVMQLHSEPGALSLGVSVSSGMSDRVVYLLAYNRKHMQLALAQSVQNGQANFRIDTTALATGITYFTICNEERRPVCERLYFKKPIQTSLLQIVSDQAQYSTRQKVALMVHTRNRDTTVLPDLSLSVFRKDALQDSSQSDISSYLWFTSELSGTVENPGYYFSDAADVAEATENVLLTHGWRRFRWEQFSGAPAFSFPPELNGQLVKAFITDGRTGKPAKGTNVYLSVPGNPFQFLASKSDSSGTALFELKNQFGPGELVFQTNTNYDSGYHITVQPAFAQSFSKVLIPAFTFSKAHTDALLQHSIGMQVQYIYHRDNLDHFQAPDVYDTIPFFGKPDYSYMLDLYTRFPTMEEVLREYVRPINVAQRRGSLHLIIFDESRQQFFDGDELVLLDGIPLFHKDLIFSYDPLKVKKLDVITRKYFIGSNFFNGIASFTTYNGNYEGLQLDPNAIVIDYEGLQLEREFYAPVYQTPQQVQSRMPDFRSTLLWQPHVQLVNGSATIFFYTSDVKGAYTIEVEGLDKNGTIYTARLPIEVQ